MIGLVTIGQAPRDDVVHSMFGAEYEGSFPQAGALDHLSGEEIATLAPREHEHPLVTRLLDGTEVVIAKERLTDLMNDAIARVEGAGARLTCVLCTGEFRGLIARGQLVYPDRLLAGVVDALAGDGTLGVVIPNAGQRTGMVAKWSRPGREVEIEVVSPYSASGDVARAVADLESRGSQLIVLDCMGYTLEMLRNARGNTSVPVVLANNLVGAVLRSAAPDLADPA